MLAALAAGLAILVIARLPSAWTSGNGLNHAAGAWTALALDLSDGLFYRPLFAEGSGYGGTRYFPLPFALHAALLRAGLDPIRSGLLLALLAGAGVVAGAAGLLRRLGLERGPACLFATLVLAAFAVQHGLGTIRGDLLPVALELGGLVAVTGAGRRRVLVAAACFVLAFAAKPTALAAPLAAGFWLVLAGDRRAATRLVGSTLVGAGAVVLVTDLLSAGRFLASLRAGATGGMTALDVLLAPVRLGDTLVREDPAALVTLGGAAFALAAAAFRLDPRAGPSSPDPESFSPSAKSTQGRVMGRVMAALGRVPERAQVAGITADGALAPLWLAAALGATLGIFASPGTGVNHLAELQAAGAVTLGVLALRPGLAGRLARAGAAATAVAGIVAAAGLLRADLGGSRLAAARAALAAAPRVPGAAILSEDALVPIVAGERPFLLDPFIVRLAIERDPSLAAPLLARLAAGQFATVILLRDVASRRADDWYGRKHLGEATRAAVRERYRLAARHEPYFVYVPSPARGPGDVSDAAERRRSADENGRGAALARRATGR
jgi:hypothetical protein